jgi:acetyl esterase/lipase
MKIFCCLVSALAVSALFPAAHAAESPTRVYKTVAGRELKLTIANPADWKPDDRRPAMVFFHGGGWTGGAPTQFERHSDYLAARGMVCFQVEYRLLKGVPKGEPPLVCVQDAKSAMRWVRSHALELGVDPRRIGAGGGSAGGHLAAFVGMVDGLDDPLDDLKVSPRANALLLFNPVFDNGPENGWGKERVGTRFREFSPAHNISADDPPTIIFLGTQDRLIPMEVVKRFKVGMDKAGVRCEALFYEGQGHGFFNGAKPETQQYYIETLRSADQFLASLGWLKGEPTLDKTPKP